MDRQPTSGHDMFDRTQTGTRPGDPLPQRPTLSARWLQNGATRSQNIVLSTAPVVLRCPLRQRAGLHTTRVRKTSSPISDLRAFLILDATHYIVVPCSGTLGRPSGRRFSGVRKWQGTTPPGKCVYTFAIGRGILRRVMPAPTFSYTQVHKDITVSCGLRPQTAFLPTRVCKSTRTFEELVYPSSSVKSTWRVTMDIQLDTHKCIVVSSALQGF